jgi:magnesium-dependent phosphatase 1
VFRISGTIVDKCNREVTCYPDVPRILSELHGRGVRLAVASRTTCTREALHLLRLFGWEQFFTYKEIYAGSKTTHFRKFNEYSGIPFARMLFFDDEHRNISDLSALGVTAILVDDEMSMSALQ